MSNYFDCKVSYEKVMENGLEKKVVEHYLVFALSFTEAESKIVEEMQPRIRGEFSVPSIHRMNLAEFFLNELGDRYYQAKLNFISLDEKSGAEKKKAVQMLVQACDIKDALSFLEAGMMDSMTDYTVVSIKESPILDFFMRKNED